MASHLGIALEQERPRAGPYGDPLDMHMLVGTRGRDFPQWLTCPNKALPLYPAAGAARDWAAFLFRCLRGA